MSGDWRRKVRRWLPGAVFLLPLLAAVAVLLPGEHNQSGASFEPLGYTRAVRDVYAAESWLVVGTDGRVVRPAPDFFTRAPRAVQDFYRVSNLPRDIADNDPRLWRIEGRLLGFAAGAQTVPSPFERGGWRGRLESQGAPAAAVLSMDGAPRLFLVPGDMASHPEADLKGLSIYAPQSGVEVDADLPGATIASIEGRDGVPLALVIQVGSATMIQAKSGVVTVDSWPRQLARDEGARLFPSSRALVSDGLRTVSLTVGGQRRAFSAPEVLGGRWTDARYAELLEPVIGMLDARAAACGDDTATCLQLRTQPYRLALDVKVDQAVKAALAASPERGAYPAGITVLDALTGDIVASASYDPQRDQPLSSGRTLGRATDYSLTPLPIGSAAKPPVSAAILSSRPQLRTLEIRHTAISDTCIDQAALFVKSLLGVPLGDAAGCGGWISTQDPHAQWINFDTFLAVSSNEYAAALAVMALAPNLDVAPPGNAWRLGPDGVPHGLPPLQEGALIQGRYGDLLNFPDWRHRFNELYGAGRNVPTAPGQTDYSVWRGLGLDAGGAHTAYTDGLSASSPVRLAFNYDQSRRVTQDYIPIILGGQNYPWTTVKLAESYARLVTGREVRARFVDDGVKPGALAPAQYPEMLHAQMCRALNAVMTRGTASKASGVTPVSLAARWRAASLPVVLYGKTGTPRIEGLSLTERRQIAAEDQLLFQGYVFTQPDGSGVPVLAVRDGSGRGAPVVAHAGAKAADAIRLLSQDRAVLKLMQGASVETAVARMVRYNDGDLAERQAAYLLDRAGGPRRVALPTPTERENAHTLAFVAAVYPAGTDPDCVSGAPLAAYAIAVNVQNPRGSPHRLAAPVLATLKARLQTAYAAGGRS